MERAHSIPCLLLQNSRQLKSVGFLKNVSLEDKVALPLHCSLFRYHLSIQYARGNVLSPPTHQKLGDVLNSDQLDQLAGALDVEYFDTNDVIIRQVSCHSASFNVPIANLTYTICVG